MLLHHHTFLLWQFVGKKKVLQCGWWDKTIFLGSTEGVPVILMVLHLLSWFLGWVHRKHSTLSCCNCSWKQPKRLYSIIRGYPVVSMWTSLEAEKMLKRLEVSCKDSLGSSLIRKRNQSLWFGLNDTGLVIRSRTKIRPHVPGDLRTGDCVPGESSWQRWIREEGLVPPSWFQTV